VLLAALASIVEGGHVFHVNGIDEHAILLHQIAQDLLYKHIYIY
jgi:hypothetical protein